MRVEDGAEGRRGVALFFSESISPLAFVQKKEVTRVPAKSSMIKIHMSPLNSLFENYQKSMPTIILKSVGNI